MAKANLLGSWGESLAAAYLRRKRYEIVACNYKTRFGEIDLIAETKDNICFIEVKTRTEGALLPPSSAVDFHKEKNVPCWTVKY